MITLKKDQFEPNQHCPPTTQNKYPNKIAVKLVPFTVTFIHRSNRGGNSIYQPGQAGCPQNIKLHGANIQIESYLNQDSEL